MMNFQFTVVGTGTGVFSLADQILTDDAANSLEIDPVVPVSITSSAPPSCPSLRQRRSRSSPQPSLAGDPATAIVCPGRWRRRSSRLLGLG